MEAKTLTLFVHKCRTIDVNYFLFLLLIYQINVILAISVCWLSGNYKIWKKRKKSSKFNGFQIGVFFFPNIRDRRQKPFEFLNRLCLLISKPPSLLNRQPSFFMVQCLGFTLMLLMLTLLAHALYILYVLFSIYLYYIYFILVY